MHQLTKTDFMDVWGRMVLDDDFNEDKAEVIKNLFSLL